MSEIDFRGARKERKQKTPKHRKVWVKLLLDTTCDDDGISERLIANMDVSRNLYGIGHVKRAKFGEKRRKKK